MPKQSRYQHICCEVHVWRFVLFGTRRLKLAGEAVLYAASAAKAILVTFTKHGYLRYD